MALLRMKVEDVVVDENGHPVVLLKEESGYRALPIWVGPAEANAIKSELIGEKPPRPMTHDLMKQLLDLMGLRLVQMEVSDVRDDTYFAELTLQVDEEPLQKMDCRPSDAIALALRTKSPMFISEELFARIERERREARQAMEREREAEKRSGTRIEPGEPTIH